MMNTLVVIPYLASAAQGNELDLAVKGWKRHFLEPCTIVVVGDYHPCVEGENMAFIPCPRIEPIKGQYTPHLDHVHKFREVRRHYPETEGFIYTCDDIYATKDFTLEDVKVPKHPEIGPYFKLDGSKGDDWWSDRMKTGELCKREGLPIRDWVCHLPVYYEWDKLFEIYDRYDCDHVSYIVENIYFSKEFGDGRSDPAKEWRDEVRTSNPGGIHPVGTMTWITNANCGWSERLEEILRKHYDEI